MLGTRLSVERAILSPIASQARRGRVRTVALSALAVMCALACVAAAQTRADASRAPAVAIASTGAVKCPLRPSSSIPSGEAWAFTVNGRSSPPLPGISSTYTHGRGAWTGGHGSGTICSQNSVAGHAPRDFVLKVGGGARASGGITRAGRRGAGIVLNVSVLASDDERCLPGARGIVVLFASYYQGHHDIVQLRLSGGCAAYDATYVGPQVVALIARNGRQVNGP
jgi:hypothetical protein